MAVPTDLDEPSPGIEAYAGPISTPEPGSLSGSHGSRVPETNPLRETLERFCWTKPLSSLCGLLQSKEGEEQGPETTRGEMAVAIEFVIPILRSRA